MFLGESSGGNVFGLIAIYSPFVFLFFPGWSCACGMPFAEAEMALESIAGFFGYPFWITDAGKWHIDDDAENAPQKLLARHLEREQKRGRSLRALAMAP